MIAAAAIALLVAPLTVLRRRTLLAYYGVLAATSIFGWILFQRVPWYDPRLACIVVAAIDLAVLSLLLARGRDVVWSPNRAAALAAIVYALVIPVIGAHAPNGDEPYYLAVSESLVHDFDFDLRNQYAAHGMGPQYNDPVGPNGEQYSRHEPFLSVLLVPGFALAGATGAIATLALFGVLLVRSTFRWMEDEGVPDAHARAVFAFFAFGAPVLFYATRMWPEVPAAFFFVEALRGARNQRLKRWLPALLGLVMLKLRFLLVAVGLVATMLLDRRPMRAEGGGRRTTLIIAALVLVVPLAVLYFLTGSATNVHSWRELLPAPAHRYVVGFFGLLADGFGGIPFQAPFYLFGLFAITRWRATPRGFRSGMLAGAVYILYLLPRPEWYGGWAPPLRYLV
ncbi:MAG TPA: hypothetical protein VE010_22990, partial [Thermoanaerobaculia bacterium]|nr:hypothetical protein [Thermoanaerobaculia bacterium]